MSRKGSEEWRPGHWSKTWAGDFEESGWRMEGEVGGRPDPGLPSATLSSISPLPLVASEFAGSTEEAWGMEKGPHMC